MHLSQHQSRIAAIVTRCGILLLVAAVVLLVNDDETQVGVGEENRRAHTDDDAWFTAVQ